MKPTQTTVTMILCSILAPVNLILYTSPWTHPFWQAHSFAILATVMSLLGINLLIGAKMLLQAWRSSSVRREKEPGSDTPWYWTSDMLNHRFNFFRWCMTLGGRFEQSNLSMFTYYRGKRVNANSKLRGPLENVWTIFFWWTFIVTRIGAYFVRRLEKSQQANSPQVDTV